MKTEVKVGAFTLGGIAMVMAVFVFLTNFSFGGSKSYDLYVNFEQAIGLMPGDSVAYAGVSVGRVDAITPNGSGVLVAVKINNDVQVPRKSTFTVTSNGVMGSKFVNIQPDKDCDMSDCYRPGEYIEGAGETGLDNVMAGVSQALKDVHMLLASMNEIMGNDETKQALKDISLNIREVTANVNVLTATLADVTVESQEDIRNVARNLNIMTSSLVRASNGVEAMVNTFSGDGQTAENLKQAISNLSESSRRINNMAASLEGVVTDPKVASDLKNILHNTSRLTEKADSMMSKVAGIKVNAGVETMYSGKRRDWITDFDVKISGGGNSFGKIGITDIGEGNRLDLQGGMRSGAFGGRAGIIEGKAGLGLDLFGGSKLQLSVDAFDPNEFKLKSRLQYEIAKDTYLFTQVNDINKRDRRATYFGLRRNF